ncbi:hypothetical protein L1O59_003912 [Salmonella enterica]|nr:hypothetical protein [Salmonella enterica subsp. enterica serovar Dahomey]EAW3041304.1 hypothetical protein [Salmonella enterica]ECD6158336.1 hypothetical protein [Salmonella enterica subsp. enterica]EAW3059982.1 hypothetical protein [Salmonella enterica]EBA1656386.1 hypothetical protein [Salmonella enterica]
MPVVLNIVTVSVSGRLNKSTDWFSLKGAHKGRGLFCHLMILLGIRSTPYSALSDQGCSGSQGIT